MSTPKERLDAAQQMSVDQLLALQCPSKDFETEFDSIKSRMAECTAQISKLQHQIQLTHENRAIRELDGKDPNAEIKTLRRALADAESGLQRGRGEMQTLVVSERGIFELKRAALWRAIHEKFVVTFERELGDAFTKLKICLQFVHTNLAGFVDANLDATSQFSPSLLALDKAASSFNTFLAKTHVSPEQFSARNELRSNLTQSVRQAFRKAPMAEVNEILKAIGADEFLTNAEWRVAEANRPTNLKWINEQHEAKVLQKFPPFERPTGVEGPQG
jgi:hypothetical protein